MESYKKLKKKDLENAISFYCYLVSREYNEIERCVNEEEYEINRAEKRKTILKMKNYLKIKF